MLDPWFSPRKVQEFEPSMLRVAGELLDAVFGRGSCDFMAEFAIEYPARIFFEQILGLDPDDITRVRRWADKIMLAPMKPTTS